MKYSALLAYDGTAYFGWQDNHTHPSIEGVLKKALTQLTQEEPLLEAASRTDRGVHAKGQVLSFHLEKAWAPKALEKGWNALLPLSIRILNITEVEERFHPSLAAKTKIYHYACCLGPIQMPKHHLYSWHIPEKIDLMRLQEEIPSLLGKHDFTGFSNHHPGIKKPLQGTCRLSYIKVQEEENRLFFELEGDRFLYKMVRNLVGTLLYVGMGKQKTGICTEILTSKDRTKGGLSAPAKGLFLYQIRYV